MGLAQPAGYGGAYGQLQPPQPGMPHAPGQYGHGRPAEVEGAARSKAQLIVGIDFVSPTGGRDYRGEREADRA